MLSKIIGASYKNNTSVNQNTVWKQEANYQTERETVFTGKHTQIHPSIILKP